MNPKTPGDELKEIIYQVQVQVPAPKYEQLKLDLFEKRVLEWHKAKLSEVLGEIEIANTFNPHSVGLGGNVNHAEPVSSEAAAKINEIRARECLTKGGV